jgi:DNA-directed RNA polymerase subunit M/transcription elongation factor TFIIS
VIRFGCPQCGKMLKVVEEKAGSPVICPRCEERCVAPTRVAASATVSRAEGRSGMPEGSSRQGIRHSEEARGLLSRMSLRGRCAVTLVAGVGTLSLLLPVLSLLLPFRGSIVNATPWAMVLVPCSLILLLGILYGEGTACPSCEKWWARTKVETEFVDRQVFDKQGIPFWKSVPQTFYGCSSCGHQWSVMETGEYQTIIRDRRQRHRR